MKFDIKKKTKAILSVVLIICILAASLISAVAQVAEVVEILQAQKADIEVWDGYDASTDDTVQYDKGAGTLASPYIISNGDQLLKMIKTSGKLNEAPAYYKLASDIYLNDISNFSQWTQEGFDFTTLNNWVVAVDNNNFAGHLDGDGKTVYGLYCENKTSIAALIPRVDHGASVKNLYIKNFYCKSSGNENVGAAGGLFAHGRNSTGNAITVTGCAITDGYISGTQTAPLIGLRFQSAFDIKNILVSDVEVIGTKYAGGICADGWTGVVNIESSLFIGIHPTSNNKNSISYVNSISNVYTDTATTLASNVTSNSNYKDKLNSIVQLSTSNFLGETAKYSLNLDWKNWETTDRYPHPIVKEKVTVDSSKVWNGSAATSYAGGSGTASNPYLISNGAQLYKMVREECSNSSVKKYFKLTDDIYLNDIGSANWENKKNLNQWYTTSVGFKSELDGDGHIIYGLYYHNDSPTNTLCAGLVSRMREGGVIKNVGLSYAYIYMNPQTTSTNVFSGGFVGMVTSTKSVPASEKTPENTMDGVVYDTSGRAVEIPRVSNCFIDHNSYITGLYAGGITSGGAFPAIVENCYVTCTVEGKNASTYGAVIGDDWVGGSVIRNCFAATQNMAPFSSGSAFVYSGVDDERSKIIGSYSFSNYSRYGVNRIKAYKSCLGQDGYNIMAKSADNPDGLGFENVWQSVDKGTPVLKMFINENHTADEFSDKYFVPPSSTITFSTGDSSVVCDPIIGGIYNPVELPTPKRKGYEFAGWFVYPELQCEYYYGYMPPRNLTLYAKWIQKSVYQDFEDFPNTYYDIDMSKWKYNKYSSWGAIAGYQSAYARGSKSSSMHRLNTAGDSDCVLNYKASLDVGRTYEMTLWVTTDESTASTTLSLVHNTWPDYLDPIHSVETIATLDNIQNKQWVECKFKFTAKTQWVSLRTTGGASLYFDDISFIPCDDSGVFSYSLTNGEVEINGIDSTFEGELEIPTTINGCTVTKIADGAFNGCHGLTSATIPSTVNSIGKGAFYNCVNLEAINVDDANTSYTSVDGVLFSKDKTELVKYPSKKSATSYAIPEGTTSLAIDSFNGCDNLKDITVAASVSKIDNYAIIGCNNLESITVAANNANYNSKNGCKAIIETATNTLIAGCKNTAIPDGVVAISGGAFYENENLGDIVIPASVTQIGDTAFKDCRNATFICKKDSYAHNFAVEKDIRYLFQNEKTPSAPVAERVEVDKIILLAVEGCEYSCDGINWQQSNVFENLSYNTQYTFYQRYAATADTVASASSVGATITTGKLNLAAPAAPTVQSVSATSVILVAVEGCEYSRDGVNWQQRNVFVGLTPATEYTFYQRYFETDVVNTSTASAGTKVTTLKAAISAPSAPTVYSVEGTCVTLLEEAGCEYSCDGINWQQSNVFENLLPCTEYTFYQRYAETDVTAASAASEGVKVTIGKFNIEAPAAPTVQSITTNSVILVAVEGCEYSRDGVNWQSRNVFVGLAPATEYTFYQRYAETETVNASAPSEALFVTTRKVAMSAPSAPIVQSVTENSVTLVSATGCEYSCDGVNWQKSNTFTSLQSGTEYTFYQRYVETDMTDASAASEGTKVTTEQAINGWIQQNGKWYYYSDNVALTGWQKLGAWYYFDASGVMVTGWQSIGGTWYYFNTSGAMVTGWQSIGGTWYYFNTSGAMVTGWQSLGAWYYFDTSGAMVTGWQSIGGTWYYFNASGAMVTGWQSLGAWYYFDASGAMVTGWQKIDGNWYYFYSDGSMASNCYIDGCWLNASGAWVQ